jgi:hypothetical protein
MVLSLIPKPKYEEEEAAVGLPRAQAVTDFSDGALAQDLPLTLQEKILGKAVAIMTPPEGLPAPVKFLYRPLLLGAVGLHALLFFAPMGGGHKAEKPAEKEKPLTITQVATGKAQPKLTKVPLSKLPPAIVKPTLPKLDRPSTPNAPVIKTPDAPTPTTTTPPPAAQTQTNTPPANLPNVTPGPPGGGAQAGDPFENFDINYPGASNAGAYYEATGAAPTAVETFFKGQSSKGFEVKEGASTAARKVLVISKGGKTNYVGLFQDGSNTVYVLQPSESGIPDSLDKLKKAKALPAGYGDIISAAAQQGGVEPGDFANSTPYFEGDNYAIGVQTMNAFDKQAPDIAYATLAPGLQAKFKAVTQEPAGFNGGLLYKMTSDAGEFYLNIVPATNGGSIVVTFSDRPG